MQFYPNDAFATDVIGYGGFELLVKNIKFHLQQYSDKYEWFRQPSLTITNDQIKDESLDLVFIDADHSYEAVSNDLPFWWKKVRKGGWLLGDDYNSCHPGTQRAVNEWATAMGFGLRFLHKPGAPIVAGGVPYPIYYFIKQ